MLVLTIVITSTTRAVNLSLVSERETILVTPGGEMMSFDTLNLRYFWIILEGHEVVHG